MDVNTLKKLIIICGVTFLFALNTPAQSAPRSITSDDFASQRPAKPKAAKKPKRTYKFIRVDNNAARSGGGRKATQTAPPNTPAKITEIGVTMWKMRPPRSGESGYLLPVLDDKKVLQMWLAERVAADTVFKAGDKVRFAVESSDIAYLYILDRETYSDGSLGEPYLIFPESARDDNSVGPGTLVDIPDQRDDMPYFNINPKKPNYTGELLTVIISPTPITNIKTDENGKVTNAGDFTGLEFGGEAELFSRVDTADKIYSKAEAESACGTKARKLDREIAGKPCGIKTRQLTREEALPQSIYRVKGLSGQPAVAFVKLSVR